MKLSNDFYENSILDTRIFEMMLPYFENDDDKDSIITYVLTDTFNKVNGYCERFLQLINNLKEHKYLEAKKYLGIKDDFIDLSGDITTLRHNIKYLLSGLIRISTILDFSTIKNYYEPYVYIRLEDSGLVLYNNLIQELDKVKSLEELDKFNEYFKDCLLEMSFKMIDIFIVRLTYTIQYFQKENLFIGECKDASLALELFKQQIETLK
jgi:hypothetical protein